MSILSRQQMQTIAERTLSFSTANETRVNIAAGTQGNTRFAVNQITSGGDVQNVTVVVTSAFGRRVASDSRDPRP